MNLPALSCGSKAWLQRAVTDEERVHGSFVEPQIVDMMSIGRKCQGIDEELIIIWFHHLSVACDTLHKLWAASLS